MIHILQFARALVGYFFKTAIHQRKGDLTERRRALTRQLIGDAKVLMRNLNYEITVKGEIPTDRNFLIVGNHMSYMDPFILASVVESMFVTSVDMRETPILGDICRMAGCIFVERRNRTTIEKDIAEMTESLQAGLNVTIYPEGKATDGRDVAAFKKSLLMSAVFAQRDILPVVIRYTELDGRPWSHEIADEISWYGEMTFTPHFLHLMKMKSLKVELEFLTPIKVTPESTRNDLAEKAHTAVRNSYLKIQ